MQKLAGKVAVVTGGGGGIGRAMGRRFGQEGMKVVLADYDAHLLDSAVQELTDGSVEVIGVPVDVTKRDSVEAMRDAALERFGEVHLLCNNAGIANQGSGQIWELEDSDWRWSLDVHLLGVAHGCEVFVPVMLAQDQEAHIVNTSSGNGGLYPIPRTPTYAVAKAAMTTYSECLWGQLRDARTMSWVSVLFPSGYTPGLLNTGIWNQRERPAEYARTSDRPLRRGLDILVEQAQKEGREVQFTPLDEVADQVVVGVTTDQFWLYVPSEASDQKVEERYRSIVERRPPSYLTSPVL
ncbi:MAG: SDR family NAD(P)-dependent oxidoreductase [Actinomycetota bacterium]|nr:SDR family NAD(P)-dependent oxidoreductase [Actinomycetota bacterium]